MNKVKEMLETLEKELRQNKQYSAADKLLPIIEEAGKNDWIPCSERLPEKYDSYLVMWKDLATNKNYYEIVEYDPDDEELWIGDIPQAGLLGYEILAWMPLPEPYKGE